MEQTPLAQAYAASQQEEIQRFRGQKAPRPQSAFIDDECDEEDVVRVVDDEVDSDANMHDSDEIFRDQPDVLEYLDQWDMPLTDKVSMLRTAANYLTSLAKNQNPELRNRRLK